MWNTFTVGGMIWIGGQAVADPIVESVRQKLLERSQVGLSKYGVGLDRKDLGRLEWLRHAQEEALDLANYLERLIQDASK